MIPGDEGKAMSIGELITDEPCDVEPYIDYCIDHWRGYLAETVSKWPEQVGRGSVEINIDMFISSLEDIKHKMRRPTPEEHRAKLAAKHDTEA